MTSYYGTVSLLLSTIQDKHTKDFEELIGSLSTENNIVTSLIKDFGEKNSIIFLSDVLKDMYDQELIKGTVRNVKPDTNDGIDYFFTIDRLTPKGLILNNNLKEKTFKELFLSTAKEKGISIFGKAALDLMTKIILK